MKPPGQALAGGRARRLQQAAVKRPPAPGAPPHARQRYWPGTLMGVGVIVALVSALTVAPWTLLAPSALLRILAGLCFIGNLLPCARSGSRLGMERLEWFLFNLLAVGPLLTALLLWANYLFHGPVASSDHAVAQVEDHGTYLTYTFSDGYLQEHWMARSNYRDWPDAHGRLLRVSTARGLLGIEVVVRKERVEPGARAE